MFRALTDVVDKSRYYEDTITHTQYRRAVCSLAWPWYPSPGCVLVLGERRSLPARVNEDRHIDVLSEMISHDISELVDYAKNMLRLFCVQFLITPVDDEREVHVEYENDRLRREKRPTIRVQHPVTWSGKGEGVMPFYVTLLRKRLVEAKTLHFSNLSQLPTDIKPILSAQDTAVHSLIQYPSLCALCWCLEDIDSRRESEIPYDRVLVGAADKVGGY